MKFGKATILVAALVGATASQALSAQGVPLRSTGGVVVNWNGPAKTHVVVAGDGRAYVIHSLRRYRVGTRVRIRGVKWGRLGLGIKWGFRPRGIKWGIRLASNGTYFAGMTPNGRATKVRLRGTVVRRYPKAVAVSVRGATFTMRTTSGAQWSSISRLNAGTVGDVGSQMVFEVRPTAVGTAVVTRAIEVAPTKPGATVPFAGVIESIDTEEGAVVVQASSDPTWPMTFVLTVPVSADLSNFQIGQPVTGSAATSPVGEPELFVKQIADNSSVEAADDPTSVVNMPLPPVDLVRMSLELRLAWIAGHQQGAFSTTAGRDLFIAQRQQLRRVERSVMRRDNARALDRLTVFMVAVSTANLPEGSRQKIDPVFQTAILEQARLLLVELTNAILNDPVGGGANANGNGGQANGQQGGGATTNGTGGGTANSPQGNGLNATGPNDNANANTEGHANGTDPGQSVADPTSGTSAAKNKGKGAKTTTAASTDGGGSPPVAQGSTPTS